MATKPSFLVELAPMLTAYTSEYGEPANAPSLAGPSQSTFLTFAPAFNPWGDVEAAPNTANFLASGLSAAHHSLSLGEAAQGGASPLLSGLAEATRYAGNVPHSIEIPVVGAAPPVAEAALVGGLDQLVGIASLSVEVIEIPYQPGIECSLSPEEMGMLPPAPEPGSGNGEVLIIEPPEITVPPSPELVVLPGPADREVLIIEPPEIIDPAKPELVVLQWPVNLEGVVYLPDGSWATALPYEPGMECSNNDAEMLAESERQRALLGMQGPQADATPLIDAVLAAPAVWDLASVPVLG